MTKHFDFEVAKAEDIVYYLTTAIHDEPQKVVENLDEFLFEREADGTVTTFRYAVSYEIMKAETAAKKPFWAEKIRERWQTLFEDFNLAFSVGVELSRMRPDLFRDGTESLALTMLKTQRNRSMFLANWHLSQTVNLSYHRQELETSTLKVTAKASNWLITQFAAKHLDVISQACATWFLPEDVFEAVDSAVDQLKAKARPLILKLLESGKREYELFLLKHLAEIGSPDDEERILSLLHEKLNAAKIEAKQLVELLNCAGRFRPNLFREQFFKYASHSSKPVRELAAELLGQLGATDFDFIFPQAIQWLEDKKSDVRYRGAATLGGLYEKTLSSDCLEVLEKRFQIETSDEVRARLVLTLIPAWKFRKRSVSAEEIQAWCKASQHSVKSVKWDWINFEEIPALEIDGRKVDLDTIKYLMVRQSRAKGISVDPEAGILIDKIDRSSSGDFACYLLESFLTSERKSEDRWAMTLACLLGDDRLVAPLAKQAFAWTESARHKMGEYALEALAILGTDAALGMVHSMILRYRTRRPNVSAVARKIMVDLAEKQGVTVDELGERFVPNLNFDLGKPRIFDFRTKSCHFSIGADFKPLLFDAKTGKKIASLPKPVTTEARSEFKSIKDSLAVVAAAQRARLEDLMLREYRWPASEWFQKYPFHPILRIFASKIVWGHYDLRNVLKGTFRILEDGSATDSNDNSVTIPKSGSVGIIHPVELEEKAIREWRRHFADYDVLPPFPQLERRSFTVLPKEIGEKIVRRWQNREVSLDLFLNRAEKRHWGHRLSGINYRMKSPPECDILAVMVFQEFPRLPGTEEKATFGIVYFARNENRDENDYAPFPLPSQNKVREDDPRLLQLDEVPRIVFSKILAEIDEITTI